MNTIGQFVLILLSSGAIAGIVSAVMQKRNEKETRLFNAKLEAYEEFAAHLESRFGSLVKRDKKLDILTLREVSAKCLLVSSSFLSQELKSFLHNVSKAYEKCESPDFDINKKTSKDMFRKLWGDAERIEDLMREDLGFK